MRSAEKLLNLSFLLLLILPLLLFLLWKTAIIKYDLFIPVICGVVISSLNYLLGITSIKIGYNKTADAFIKYIIGGSILRLFLMLVLILVGLKILELSPNTFIFSVLFFYIFFLIIEIFYLNLRKNID